MQIFIVYISLCSWNVWKTLLSLKNFVFIYMHTIIVTWEKAMAPHSSTLAWKIPWTEEHGRLQSMGSLRVGHDWATSLSLFTFTHWRRKWQPTPVFLPGESQGQGSLVGCRLWGHTESDTTEATQQHQQHSHWNHIQKQVSGISTSRPHTWLLLNCLVLLEYWMSYTLLNMIFICYF